MIHGSTRTQSCRSYFFTAVLVQPSQLCPKLSDPILRQLPGIQYVVIRVNHGPRVDQTELYTLTPMSQDLVIYVVFAVGNYLVILSIVYICRSRAPNTQRISLLPYLAWPILVWVNSRELGQFLVPYLTSTLVFHFEWLIIKIKKGVHTQFLNLDELHLFNLMYQMKLRCKPFNWFVQVKTFTENLQSSSKLFNWFH